MGAARPGPAPLAQSQLAQRGDGGFHRPVLPAPLLQRRQQAAGAGRGVTQQVAQRLGLGEQLVDAAAVIGGAGWQPVFGRAAVAVVAPTPQLSARRNPAAEDERFDRLIYGRVRLGIMSALAVNEQLSFNDLKTLFDVTDGNLGAHARKLEDAGYIACRKKFAARVPKTEYSLTAQGKRVFARHLEHMEALIHAAKGT